MSDKARSMVLGSFIGDSLALGVHWIYDQSRIARERGRVEALLAPPPDSYHKSKKAGDLTHYGDQTMVLLESLAEGGGFDLAGFSARWRSLFEGGQDVYLDRATRNTLSRLAEGWGPTEAGSGSDELAGASRIAPLVYALRDAPEAMASACRAQTTMTHNNAKVADASEFFGRTALAVLDGVPPADAMAAALKGRLPGSPLHAWFEDAMKAASEDSVAAIARFGQSCHMDGAFQSTVQLIAAHAGDPAGALTASAMAGGDSAARNMLAGMVLCACNGVEALPRSWVEGLNARTRIEELLAKLDRA
ncbi:MAG: ADP-ribosylglycohydrolase family protein [Thermodesulfobacteriota bacterium]